MVSTSLGLVIWNLSIFLFSDFCRLETLFSFFVFCRFKIWNLLRKGAKSQEKSHPCKLEKNNDKATQIQNLQDENDHLAIQLVDAQKVVSFTQQAIGQNALNQNNNALRIDSNRSLRDYFTPKVDEIQLGYTVPKIAAEEYLISPEWIYLVQENAFHGLAHEDPIEHLANFEELCNLIKIKGIEPNELKLLTFTFSLADKAKSWIRRQRPEYMDTWSKVANQFLINFFPFSKTNSLRAQIHNFLQHENETLSEAWERYHELQRACPHHGFEQWNLLQIFYNGLRYHDKCMVDMASRGSFMNKSIKEGYKLLDDMAFNQSQWYQQSRINEEHTNIKLANEVAALTKKGVNANSVTLISCSICDGIGHYAINCDVGLRNEGSLDQINAINHGTFWPINDPYSNTYNQRWKNCPNFAICANSESIQVYGDQGYAQQIDRLEKLVEQFMESQTKTNLELNAIIELLSIQSKLIENQIAQQATLIDQNLSTLPSKLDPNQRAQVSVISILDECEEEIMDMKVPRHEQITTYMRVAKISCKSQAISKVIDFKPTQVVGATVVSRKGSPTSHNLLLRDAKVDGANEVLSLLANRKGSTASHKNHANHVDHAWSISYEKHWENHDALTGRKVKVKLGGIPPQK